MGVRVPLSTEKKLDMSLDDLVERKPARGSADFDEDDRRAGRRDNRYGPYARREGGGGKGKGKRRMSPEDKALLHSYCFFNADGDFVVRLYDTEVFTLRKRPEIASTGTGQVAKTLGSDAPTASAPAGAEAAAAPAGDASGVKPNSGASDKPSSEGGEKPAADGTSDVGGKPGAGENEGSGDGGNKEPGAAEKPSAPAATATSPSSGGGVVIVLSSGGFRTVETRYILNEALHSLAVSVTEGPDGRWQVAGPSMASRPFEDGMSFPASDPEVRASIVKDYVVGKIAEAKEREAMRLNPSMQHRERQGDFRLPPHMLPPLHWGPPPALHPLHGGHPHQRPPPPGWGWPHGLPLQGPPPPSWAHGPPPPWDASAAASAAGTQPRPHPHQPHVGGQPPAAAGAAQPAMPPGPLPDSMFQ